METIYRVSPVFGVKNVRATAEYYRDVLGFSLDPIDGVFQPTPEEPQGVYAIVKFGNTWIHFQIRRGEFETRVRGPQERDLYLYVDDAEEFHSELHRNGANIITPLREAPYGLFEFTIEDLNGIRITFGAVE